jgi:BirA family biotin operon repressor/biotin-[acetyl-CoA-carboxylase] ligase
MEFAKSKAIARKLVWISETGSTNSDLIAAAATGGETSWPDFSVYVTGYQTAGRGRSGRQWLAAAGSSLFVSVLLRPKAPIETFGWLPLLAGLAMSRAVASRLNDFGVSAEAAKNASIVGVKWPNDILVGEQKVSGVLSELLPDGSGVVIGAGLNLTLTREQLPVETATSLALLGDPAAAANAGGPIDAETLDDILCRYLSSLRELVNDFNAYGGDAALAGLQQQFVLKCVSLGQQVKVMLPGDDQLWGTAKSIDEQGRIVVETQQGQSVSIAAGDIVHLRHQ